jgi:hypothetical protein
VKENKSQFDVDEGTGIGVIDGLLFDGRIEELKC